VSLRVTLNRERCWLAIHFKGKSSLTPVILGITGVGLHNDDGLVI